MFWHHLDKTEQSVDVIYIYNETVSCSTKTIKGHKIKKTTHYKLPGPSPGCCLPSKPWRYSDYNPRSWEAASRLREHGCENNEMKNCACWPTLCLMRSAAVRLSIMPAGPGRYAVVPPHLSATLWGLNPFSFLSLFFFFWGGKHGGVNHLSTTQDLLISAASCSPAAQYRKLPEPNSFTGKHKCFPQSTLGTHTHTHTQPPHYKVTSWQTSY